jgi:hypothetical protein
LIEQGDSEISKIEEEMEEVAIRLQKKKAEVTALKALDLPALPAIVMRAFLQRRVAAEIPLPEDGVMQEAYPWKRNLSRCRVPLVVELLSLLSYSRC